MNYENIVKAINNKVGSSNYSIWTIGVTDDPDKRKQEHQDAKENVTYWSQWKTDSEDVGRDVEKHFLDLKMKGGTGGGGRAGYVYVF